MKKISFMIAMSFLWFSSSAQIEQLYNIPDDLLFCVSHPEPGIVYLTGEAKLFRAFIGNDTIRTDTRWRQSRVVHNALVVDSAVTLTIMDSVFLTPSARIIVRPGGKLIVDGGTLTSACAGEMWQGIEVVGNRTQHQTAAHQGTVILRNEAVIENAHCAIKTGLEGRWT